MAELSREKEIIGIIQKQLNNTSRFESANTMIPNPDSPEMQQAIEDAVDDINLKTHLSNYTLEAYWNKGNPYRRLLRLATEINIYKLLIKDWVANGMDVDLGDLSLPSKLGDYQSLLSDLKIEFDEIIESVKKGKPRSSMSSFSTKPTSLNGRSSAYLQALRNQLEKNRTVY